MSCDSGNARTWQHTGKKAHAAPCLLFDPGLYVPRSLYCVTGVCAHMSVCRAFMQAAAQLALDNTVSKVASGLVASVKAVSALSSTQLASEVEELSNAAAGTGKGKGTCARV